MDAVNSVGETSITRDAVILQRYAQQTHFPNSYCHGLSLSELTSHDPLGTWTQHFQNQQLVDQLVIQRRKTPLPLTDQIYHECSLAPHPIKNSRRRTWHFRRIHHDTLALLNAKHVSCSIQSGKLKIIILLDITDKFNSLTF